MTDEEASIIFKRVHRKRWFKYDLGDALIKELEIVYLQPRDDRMDNILLYGEPNSGKTEIVKKFKRNMSSRLTRREDILFFRAPAKPAEGALYDKMLRAASEPYKITENAAKKKDAVYTMMERRRIRLLIVDDISNIVASTLSGSFLRIFREMSTDLKFAIAATGIADAKAVLSLDSQMRSRFDFFEVPSWEYNEAYLSLIASFENGYGFPKKSDLVKFSDAIYEKTGGYLGQTRNLLKKAALKAIYERSDRILKKHLDAVGNSEGDGQETAPDT